MTATPGPGASPGYEVELEQFAGPLDLLLYLVRKEEVEVESLPIARITERYLQHLEKMPLVDLDRAGEFLVMASTLLGLKARALLPKEAAEAAAGTGDEAGAAPKDESQRGRERIVQLLLEYRTLREQTRALEEQGDLFAKRYGREAASPSPRGEGFGEGALPDTGAHAGERDVPIVGGDLWDLATAFARIEHELSLGSPDAQVLAADVPIERYADRLREHLAAAGPDGLEFQRFFQKLASRHELVAMFVALLELVRRGEARALQVGPFGEIRIVKVEAPSPSPAPAP